MVSSDSGGIWVEEPASVDIDTERGAEHIWHINVLAGFLKVQTWQFILNLLVERILYYYLDHDKNIKIKQ
jgi:hypothetical protein